MQKMVPRMVAKIAQKKKIQGRVIVKFIIGTDGYIEQIRALGPDPMLEAEAKRIISLLPKFIPAIDSDGKTMSVPFTVPITFGLGI